MTDKIRLQTKGEAFVEKALKEYTAGITPEDINSIEWTSAEVIDVVGKALDRLFNYDMTEETLNNVIYSTNLSTKIETITRMLQAEDGCSVPILQMNVGRKYGIEPVDLLSTFLARILLHHTKEDVYPTDAPLKFKKGLKKIKEGEDCDWSPNNNDKEEN